MPCKRGLLAALSLMGHGGRALLTESRKQYSHQVLLAWSKAQAFVLKTLDQLEAPKQDCGLCCFHCPAASKFVATALGSVLRTYSSFHGAVHRPAHCAECQNCTPQTAWVLCRAEAEREQKVALLNENAYDRRTVKAVYKQDGTRGHHMQVGPECCSSTTLSSGTPAVLLAANLLVQCSHLLMAAPGALYAAF